MKHPEHANKVGKPSLLIHLHVAIPSIKENRLVAISALARAKIALHRLLDWSAWLVLGKFQFKGYNYARREYSNRGDIAIKLAIKELLRAQFADADVTFTESEWGNLSDLTVREINAQAALFVVAGGGYWVFDRAKRMSPSFLADLPYFEQITCPVTVLGSGVNFNMPKSDSVIDVDIEPELRSALLRFDRRVDLLAVRCRSTFEFFNAIGMQKARLVCDPAVFKAITPDLVPTQHDVLAIGINLAFHGKFVERLFEQNIALYIAFLKTIAQQFKSEFYYFIHSDEEFLVAQILKAAGIKLTVVDVPANDLAGAYCQVDVLLCQMMHSNILSFCAGVPALNIAYDSKNIGFNDLIGMQEFCISAYAVTQENLIEKMTKLIQQRVALKAQLAARKVQLDLAMQAILRDLGELAHQRARGLADHSQPLAQLTPYQKAS